MRLARLVGPGLEQGRLVSARTLYDIYVPNGPVAKVRVAQYSNLDSAVEEVKRMMRQDPTRAVRLEVIPPEHQDPDAGPAPVRPYTYGRRLPSVVNDVTLIASWEAQHGASGEPNPFETLVQKATQEHMRVVEQACEEALQGGEYGVRVDIYPGRTEAHVDPTVPYGTLKEHQHLVDPRSAL